MSGKQLAEKLVLSAWKLPLWMAFYLTCINLPFLIKAYHFMQADGLSWPLLFSLPLFLFCISLFICSLLSIKYLEKPVLIGLILLSSLLSYSYGYYGLIFDDHSTVLGSMEQTNWQEIRPFLTLSLLSWIFITGILPAYLLYKVKINRPSIPREIVIKALYCLSYPLFYIAIIWPYFSLYHPLIRLSGLAARPPFQIIPTNFVENAVHYYQEKWSSQLPYKEIGVDAVLKNPANQNTLLVMVIGETARGQNLQLNGYKRPTNAYTKKQDVVSFRHMTACATATRDSVPCIFSSLSRKEFIRLKADHEDNLLDILKRVGFHSFWIDNNGAGDCQGVCKHIALQITQGADNDLVQELRGKISEMKNNNSLIVLHLQGSHGPNYHEKYPLNFRKFIPDCQRNELRLCDNESLINAYDNSILYTDFVLHRLINVLKKQTHFTNTALIYTSDHGESIGEHGYYGHCAPYALAPQEQTQVPLLVWVSPQMATTHHLSLDCLKNLSQNQEYSHDYLFHSVLGLLDVSTRIYQPELDLFQDCRLG